MPDLNGRSAGSMRRSGALTLVAVMVAILLLRGLTLLFDHSLNSIDGALQTWFALDNFVQGRQLGTDFQSYLGVTMILALMPVYAMLGQTLYASTVAANVMVIVAAFWSAYAIMWMVRGVRPGQRWGATVILVFALYYALRIAAETVGLSYPASSDPGVSLRPLRGFLPFLVLPLFVVLLRKVLREGRGAWGGLLGLVAGAGLLWSNDAGIPLVIAIALGLAIALHRRVALLLTTLAAYGTGVAVSAVGLLMLVTHGQPGPWLRYNFSDVAGDQLWFFAPWDRSTRILELADLPNIVRHGELLSTASLIVLVGCVLFAVAKALRGRGAPVHGAAFIFVGSSLIGTALIPQIGGHVGPEYNAITFMLGLCAPLILGQQGLFRLWKPVLRAAGQRLPILATGLAAAMMIGIEAMRLAVTSGSTDRVVYDATLGFRVRPDYSADLQAMRRLSAAWDASGIPADRRLLSVYTSPLDIVARVDSSTPVGSLIHALGEGPRTAFTGVVAEGRVEAVTTIAPDYSGWEGWIVRAHWPFFRQLYRNYTPIARNAQHVLWARGRTGAQPSGPATCRVSGASHSTLLLDVTAPRDGLATLTVLRQPPFGSGRGALLTVTEDSPDTRRPKTARWADFPRYGIANSAQLSLLAPVAAGVTTRLRLNVMDGSAIGSARCSAQVDDAIDVAALPPLPVGIDRHVAARRP